MPAGHGLRSRTRDTFSRGFRQKGYINLTTYLRSFRLGDYVDIKVNGAVHKVGGVRHFLPGEMLYHEARWAAGGWQAQQLGGAKRACRGVGAAGAATAAIAPQRPAIMRSERAAHTAVQPLGYRALLGLAVQRLAGHSQGSEFRAENVGTASRCSRIHET